MKVRSRASHSMVMPMTSELVAMTKAKKASKAPQEMMRCRNRQQGRQARPSASLMPATAWVPRWALTPARAATASLGASR